MSTEQSYKDQLKEIEKRWQQYWLQTKQFESDVPENWQPGMDKKKFLVTFPFPYMNGRLHLGHLFSLTKSEFSAGYHILKGENVLFPFGFHVTGQPICGATKKLEAELAKYGNPPVVSTEPEVQEEAPVKVTEEKVVELGKFGSNKSKAKAKAGKFQFQILLDFGIKPENLQSFTDPLTWINFFPPLCQEDLHHFGARVDWRRSFYTTDANPVYDSFIRWQFNELKKGGYIKFGKRNTIWSPADDQPCMDHDRASGEGVQLQEYVIVLTELIKSHPKAASIYSKVSGDDIIYLACATLRPETMCGQTNVWIQPEETYLLIRIDKSKVILTGEHAALNMAFQDKNNGQKMGVIDKICQIQGVQFINCMVKAPLTPLPAIPVLPLMTILMTKGTGVVTSVPSDAPDDYMALKDIKNNFNGIVEKYNIDISQIPKDIIEIIEIPGFGTSAAATQCEERQVKSQFDKETLKELKDLCYSKGFYEGIMIAGPFKGEKVQNCKLLCRQFILDNQSGFLYSEPQSQIISRSGCECVVALADQWYLNYGEEKWKLLAQRNLEFLETFNDDVKNQFARVLDWLKQWAVSRSFGLGTKMPWDQKVLIESLSDSTIYNAFYTIAHVLQNGTLDGSKCPIPVELLDDDFYNFIFDKSPEIQSKHSQIAETMKYLKRSFLYWYPVDLRCSGKDLVQNHLTMMIYNHCAIWADDESKWPRGMRSNGHLLIDDQKMAKSSGNFLEAKQSIDMYSSDAIRFALADAGDGIEDANFKRETADGAVMKLIQLLKANQQLVENSVERAGDQTCDKIFTSQIVGCAARADKAFAKCLFREGVIIAHNEMNKCRELYVKTAEQQGQKLCKAICVEFVRLQSLLIGVVCPHIAEEMNQKILGATESVFKQMIPDDLEQRSQSLAINIVIYDQVNAMINRLRSRYNDVTKVKKDGTLSPKPMNGTVYVATQYLPWQEKVIEFLGSKFAAGEFGKDIVGVARKYVMDELKVDPKEAKLVVKFVTDAVNLSKTEGVEAFVTKMPFDEKSVYQEYEFLMKQQMNLETVQVFHIGEGPIPALKCAAALPGRPIIFFE